MAGKYKWLGGIIYRKPGKFFSKNHFLESRGKYGGTLGGNSMCHSCLMEHSTHFGKTTRAPKEKNSRRNKTRLEYQFSYPRPSVNVQYLPGTSS